jgi:hypothetical protein
VNHGYLHIDSDARGAGDSRAAQAWRTTLAHQGTPAMIGLAEQFVKVARYDTQPVALEYGMFARVGGINILHPNARRGR